MSEENVETIFETLSDLLNEAYQAVEDEVFINFALENQSAVKIALYADCVTKGYALASGDFYRECEESIAVFQKFIRSEIQENEK